MEPALALSNLRLHYKGADAPALEDVSFSLEAGETLVISGPAASGKTSLCLALKGLIPQAREARVAGEIRIQGRDISKFRVQTLSTVAGLVLQDPEVQIVGRTVAEDVAFGPRNLLIPAQKIHDRIPRVLDQVGLAGYEDRISAELSGGEKQRLALAGVLAMAPKLLILDEPASELDPAGRNSLYDLLERLKKEQGITLVIVDQRLETLDRLGDLHLHLDQGRVGYLGPPKKDIGQSPREIAGFSPSYIHPSPAHPWEGYDGVDSMAESPENTAVSVRGLNFGYHPDQPLIKDLNFDLPLGGFTALMGHNGAGKTTLIKQLNGLLSPQSGKITILGRPIGEYAPGELTRTVGFVFQNPDHQIFETSVEREIAAGLSHLSTEERRERIQETLAFTGLQDLGDRHPFTLAKGDRQRIAVASIIALDPKILVVDEPTTGLDARGAEQVMGLIHKCHGRGTAILLISHDFNLVTRHAQRLAVMHRGQWVMDEPMDRALAGALEEDILTRTGILPMQGERP